MKFLFGNYHVSTSGKSLRRHSRSRIRAMALRTGKIRSVYMAHRSSGAPRHGLGSNGLFF